MTHTRQSLVRVIASSRCFDAEPPYVKRLDQARQAGAHIVDALVDAGALGPEFRTESTVNGHDPADDAIVAADVDTVPAF